MEFTTKELQRMSNTEGRARDLEIDKITKLAMNVYDTKVDGIDDGLIEYLLWHHGKCMIWYSEVLGWVATACSEVGQDINGLPNRWKPTLSSNIGSIPTPELGIDECVVFYDSLDPAIRRRDVLSKCWDYADVHMTIRQQVFNQKTPMLGVVGSPKLRDKIRNAFVSIADNCKMLLLDWDLSKDLKPLDFNAPYNVESLYQYKKSVEAEMLEHIGIDYKDAFAKKERLVVDEQEGNDETLNYILADGLKARQKAIDQLPNLGLSGSVAIQPIVRPIDTDVPVGSDDKNPSNTE